MYPYGATLNVAQPSVVALSSGSLAVPMNRPICAYYYSEASGGKLVVLGSSKMLNDMYIEKEKNDLLREVIFDFFESKEIVTKEYQMDDVDVSFKIFMNLCIRSTISFMITNNIITHLVLGI